LNSRRIPPTLAPIGCGYPRDNSYSILDDRELDDSRDLRELRLVVNPNSPPATHADIGNTPQLLGYLEPRKFEGMTEDERCAVFDECFEHNDRLRSNGHLVAEIALQPPETALTLYWKNGKVATTDGPYAET
jgi:hypothetical protein